MQSLMKSIFGVFTQFATQITFCAGRRDVCMYIRPSINTYFQFSFYLDKRDTDAIVAHLATRSAYQATNISLSGAGGNVDVTQGTREIYVQNQQSTQLRVPQGQSYHMAKKKDGTELSNVLFVYSLAFSSPRIRDPSILDIDHLSPSSPFVLRTHESLNIPFSFNAEYCNELWRLALYWIVVSL